MSEYPNSPSIESPEWQERVAWLFDTARTLSADGRQEFLDRECRPPELREQIERLVAADAAADDGGFLVNTVGPGSQETLEATSDFSEADGTAAGAFSVAGIGKYELIEQLGQGGFGDVFLAEDPDLQIKVAIKVANRRSGDFHPDMFLQEARTVARLNHPHIVPVRHFGQTEDGQCFVVSNYIDGGDLAARTKGKERLSWNESARLIASIAEALYHAHTESIYHRDVKPSNILLDGTGKAFLTDFGIALTEADYGKVDRQAGTVLYMSPEQARNEGHLVDGRSDVFSLGIVLYELLACERPFRGKTPHEVCELIKKAEPRPPRELDKEIPQELERICLRALEKQRTSRYATAWDMSQDLWEFVGRAPPPPPPRAQIVPRGLRSFETEDQGFFLELLPGPRDIDGLPQSIRFWKTRIEQRDAEKTFRVGFLYGPSGCGKSSLLKAGLIPQLAPRVMPLYVESSEGDTEARLLQQLRNTCHQLPQDLSLTDSVAALRRGIGLPGGPKVLLILDQFEQWLHGHRDEDDAKLIEALRQCDGRHVQCLISVRADFWMAIARLADQLDIVLSDEKNFAKVDLFDENHARNVLTAFGRAYGTLPADPEPLSASQESFVQTSVSGLAAQGRIICVHLALFAEMVRSRTWSPEVLASLGGAKGVGYEFLKESFGGEMANPRHRLHKDHAQGILEALLPEHGASIRAPQQSEQDLFGASGCRDRKSFQEVIHVLNDELRLTTPAELADESPDGPRSAGRYYQLTHDYLVPSIRDWIADDSIATVSGRARLRLKQLALVWGAKRETKYLPNLWEYLKIKFVTSCVRWNSVQQEMMRRAGRFHVVRTLIVLAILVAGGFAAYQYNGRIQAGHLVHGVLGTEINELPESIRELNRFLVWATPELRQVADNDDVERPKRLRASLVLLPQDPTQLTYLKQQLLACEVSEFGIIRDALCGYQQELRADLWHTFRDENEDTQHRFHAGLALAAYAPDADNWAEEDAEFLVEQMLDAKTDHHPILRDYLRPISRKLIVPLHTKSNDHSAREAIREGAVNAMVDLASHEDSVMLAQMACEATPAQHRVIFEWLVSQASSKDEVRATLEKITETEHAEDQTGESRVSLGKRRAGAAITLIRMGQTESAVKVFRVTDDPEALTQFAAGHKHRRVTAQQLLNCLQLATDRRDVLGRYGLLLALAEFQFDELPATSRELLCEKLKIWYGNDPSPAIHGASGWLLREWGLHEETAAVDHTLVASEDTGVREWFVQRMGDLQMTFVVLQPGQFEMGSRNDPFGNENLHQVRLTHPLAVADREINVAEWKSFMRSTGHRYNYDAKQSETDAHAVSAADWYMAVEFCRWLTELAGMSEAEQCYDAPESLPADQKQRLPNDRFNRVVPGNWPCHPEKPGFRLPTEAEWEYACRGGMRTAYSFGSDEQLLGRYGWYEANANTTLHVGRKKCPNLNGLFDMHGNLYEWCHDWYSAPLDDEIDPIGPSSGTEPVLRGGGWDSKPLNCRSSDRSTDDPVGRKPITGFRVVRSLPGGDQ